ncbi:myo-inositol 2-dehydrogenase / D-chiro-inositol 1-dehydrogenase [Paenibacillus sp. yr247]|uniref:Gfo/Idh/MocA family protein n=1 Tax=Paenibacillus sp. yr247 TaxID=1761880 RepID=UPI0008831AB8|nr:Gfo/Idh/MocA family oxidoreductase [Paenibacillus sp. yr247]SDP09580.1 myo-inositol 2-dehydrogenase / D-chiro-inositol 1-dehydrogenase [Paenibacillus sp. yr247]
MKIGVVGAGNMGGLHVSLFKNRTDVEFVGVTDIDLDRCNKFSEIHGGKAYKNVQEMIQTGGAEIVFVTIPNTKHKQVILDGLREGAVVFGEKPFVTSIADADEIMTELAGKQNRLYNGFNRRFAPVYAKAKELVQQGFQVRSANIIMNDGDMTSPPWVTNTALTGGFLYDTTIHMFDMVRFLVGEIAEVRCIAQQCHYPLQDNFSFIFTTTSGQSIVMSSNGHASWAYPSERIQLWGDHATIVTEELDNVMHCGSNKSTLEITDVKNLDRNMKWGYAQMHEDFLGAIAANQPFSITPEDAYKSVLITESCYISAANGGKAIQL